MQKVLTVEDASRRIASKSENSYIAAGINPHEASQVAPSALLQPFSEELENCIFAKHQAVESALRRYLGEPFYSASGFILYKGNSADFLDKLSSTDIRADLTVTSPPYNIGKEYEHTMSVEEYVSWCSSWMCQIHEITKSSGAFWLNVGYLKVPDKGLCIPIPYLLWDKSPFYLLQEVVWQYGAGVSTKYRLSPRNEKWLFYVKNFQEYTFNLDDIRDPNVKYPNQKKKWEVPL